MKKAIYYTKNFGKNYLPKGYFKWRFEQLKKTRDLIAPAELEERLNYYVRVNEVTALTHDIDTIAEFKFQKPSSYYFDLKEYLHYFKQAMQLTYLFGDDTPLFDQPTLIKARPIAENNQNSILFKLDKIRHFRFVNDNVSYNNKKFQLVWRGAAHQPIRKLLLQKFQNKNLFDVGDVSNQDDVAQWRKPFLTLEEQLQSKFIFCPEGRDVATSLKWIFSSNSLCIMPKPQTESWFMEDSLQPNVHYAIVRDDLEDLEDVMHYYSENTKKAEEIIYNAQQHAKRFMNKDVENLLCYEVLKKYSEITNQNNVLRFE